MRRDVPPDGVSPLDVSLLDNALCYAAAGIPVVPLHTPDRHGCTCAGDAQCTSPGKHPRLRHGLRQATTDSRLIRSWWRRWPAANVGLATGTALDVCDVDTDPALGAVLNLLNLPRPAGPLVRTGLGWHLWFAPSGSPSRVGLLPNVDWRGRGGLVVAPPSLHATGRRYTFVQPWTLGIHLPACPSTLRHLLVRSDSTQPVSTRKVADLDRYAQAALDGEVRRILSAPRPQIRDGRRVVAGGRNNALHLAAFRLGQLAARGGLDAAAVWQQLTGAALAVGLRPAETRRTISSGWRAGLRHPRS